MHAWYPYYCQRIVNCDYVETLWFTVYIPTETQLTDTREHGKREHWNYIWLIHSLHHQTPSAIFHLL